MAPLVALVAVVAAAGLIFAAAAGAASVKQIWDGSATPTWTAQIGGSGASNDAANAVVATSGGVTFVTGHIATAAGTTDLTLTEFVNGAKKWTKTYNGAGHGNDGGAAIAFGPKGTLYANHIGDNAPHGVAVAGTTCWVVGSCATPASGTDQIILGFAY